MPEETNEERRTRIRKFLSECSGVSLSDFQLARYNEAANFWKEMVQLMEGYLTAEADARLAAEANLMREEAKHNSTIPFPKKVAETPPQGHAPVGQAALKHGDHGRRNSYAESPEQARQFFKR